MVICVAMLAAGHAASNMTVEKEEAFQTSVPAALLLDPDSDSVLFEKNGDQLVAPASLAKLMTLEYVFNEIKQGRVKLTDEFIISENAWRKGGAPSHGSTMFAAIHSRVKLDDLIHGIIVDSANDACIAIAEAMAGNEAEFGAMLTQRAREIGLEKSTFTNATGYSDPNLRVTPRELAQLARHIMQTYPDFYPLFRRARIHLEQDPPAEPQSAAGHGHRRRRAQDRRNQRSRLQSRGFGGAERFAADRRRHRREVRQGTRRRGAQDAGLGLPRLRGARPVRRRPDHRRGEGLRRRSKLRPAGRPGHDPPDDAAQRRRAA